jgi:hypothetical protein
VWRVENKWNALIGRLPQFVGQIIRKVALDGHHSLQSFAAGQADGVSPVL